MVFIVCFKGFLGIVTHKYPLYRAYIRVSHRGTVGRGTSNYPLKIPPKKYILGLMMVPGSPSQCGLYIFPMIFFGVCRFITWNKPLKKIRRNPNHHQGCQGTWQYLSIFRVPIFSCNGWFLWWTPLLYHFCFHFYIFLPLTGRHCRTFRSVGLLSAPDIFVSIGDGNKTYREKNGQKQQETHLNQPRLSSKFGWFCLFFGGNGMKILVGQKWVGRICSWLGSLGLLRWKMKIKVAWREAWH